MPGDRFFQQDFHSLGRFAGFLALSLLLHGAAFWALGAIARVPIPDSPATLEVRLVDSGEAASSAAFSHAEQLGRHPQELGASAPSALIHRDWVMESRQTPDRSIHIPLWRRIGIRVVGDLEVFPPGIGWSYSEIDQYLESSRLDVPPRPLNALLPVYPQQAIRLRVIGRVVVLALIDEAGVPEKAGVIKSDPMLDQAAVSAVTRARFVPGQVNRKFVKSRLLLEFEFSMPGGRESSEIVESTGQ